jgi:GNAT superfamily N-acetyltransferase
MPDMIVRLYDLPDPGNLIKELGYSGIIIKRAIGPEKRLLEEWCRDHFTEHAASEVSVGMSRSPVGVFVAVKDKKPVGYACYDATVKGFFGPTGVLKEFRGLGIGKALLLKTLSAMYEDGYAYAIIGGVGPKEFYIKNCNAIEIPDSTPGIYSNMIDGI